MRNQVGRFRQWVRNINLIPCKCGSRDNHWNVKGYAGGQVCEAEIACDDCGTIVNHWAYGNLHRPETYTGLIVAKAQGARRWFAAKINAAGVK